MGMPTPSRGHGTQKREGVVDRLSQKGGSIAALRLCNRIQLSRLLHDLRHILLRRAIAVALARPVSSIPMTSTCGRSELRSIQCKSVPRRHEDTKKDKKSSS